MRKKGKTVAGVAVASGVVIILLAAVILKDRIAESYFLWKLESGEGETRRNAAAALGRLRSRRAVAPLLQIVREDKATREFPFKRQYVAIPLSESWYTTPPANRAAGNFPVLESLEPEFWILYWPGRTLAAIGDPAIPALIEALKDEDEFVRVVASEALGDIGTPAVPALLDIIQEARPRLDDRIGKDAIRRSLYALGRMGPDAGSAVSGLLSKVKDRNIDGWIRSLAAWALGNIVVDEQPAMRDLEAVAREDPNEDVRLAASAALSAIQWKIHEMNRR